MVRRIVWLLIVGAALAGVGYPVVRHLYARHHFAAARDAASARRFDDARDHIDRVLDVSPENAEAHLLAARIARRADRYDDAESHLRRSKDLGWDAEAVKLEWAMLEAQRDDPTAVEMFLLGLVNRDHPETALICEALTQGYMRTFQLGKVLFFTERWLEREPQALRALLWRGTALERLVRFPEAADCYARALEVDPGLDEVRARLGDLLVELKRFQEAKEQLEPLRDRQADDPTVLLALARAHLGLGECEEARRLLARLLDAHPDLARALAERGRLELVAGQPAQAEPWLRRAAELEPCEPDTVFDFARCLRQLGKADEARTWEARYQQLDADQKRLAELSDRAIRDPHNPAPRCEIGVIMLRNRREQEGLWWLRSALRSDPKHAPSHQALSDYYAADGRADLAARHRELARQNSP